MKNMKYIDTPEHLTHGTQSKFWMNMVKFHDKKRFMIKTIIEYLTETYYDGFYFASKQ